MRLLVVGAGSTGGYFGGRLAQAGRDVTFLVRPNRAADLQANGLQILSPHGNFTLTPKLVTASDLAAAGGIDLQFDAILLTVKSYALEAALDDLAPAVGPDTMILPTLNGMRHVDIVTARFGRQALAGCVCRIAARLDEEGRIVELGNFHELEYGELDGAWSERIVQLDVFMQNAGFSARLSMAIEQDMWEKWVMLASLAGITCLMRGSVGEIVAAPGGSDFVNLFLDEVAAVATAAGHAPSESYLAEIRALLTAQGSALTASMYRDLQGGGPIEADQIIGDLFARARRANVSTPLLAVANTHLAVYQNRRTTL